MVLVVLGVVLVRIEIVAKLLLLLRLKNDPQDHQNHHAIQFVWKILSELFLGDASN